MGVPKREEREPGVIYMHQVYTQRAYDEAKAVEIAGNRFYKLGGHDAIDVELHYADGTTVTYPGVATGRRLLYVTVAGNRYENMDVELVEHYDDGVCVAIDYDGVRYGRVDGWRWWPCGRMPAPGLLEGEGE